MKLWVKIIMWLGIGTILSIGIIAIFTRATRNVPPVDKEFTKGLMDSAWMEMPRHDVRLRSPGVWEEAWLDTTYWLRLRDVNSPRLRTVEINREMYWKCLSRPSDMIELNPDSAEVAEKQAEWDADSIKYSKTVKEQQERAMMRLLRKGS